jgi:hypothetical protein
LVPISYERGNHRQDHDGQQAANWIFARRVTSNRLAASLLVPRCFADLRFRESKFVRYVCTGRVCITQHLRHGTAGL